MQNTIPNCFWINQYENHANPEAHQTTTTELIRQIGEDIDYLFIAVSTGGTIMGFAQEIAKRGLGIKIVPVDALGSKIYPSVNCQRLIPGMGASRQSHFIDNSYLEPPVHVSDLECIMGCRALLQTEGIMAGGSTGGVVMAIKQLLPSIPRHSKIAFLAADRGDRYINTIYDDEWVTQNFMHEAIDNSLETH